MMLAARAPLVVHCIEPSAAPKTPRRGHGPASGHGLPGRTVPRAAVLPPGASVRRRARPRHAGIGCASVAGDEWGAIPLPVPRRRRPARRGRTSAIVAAWLLLARWRLAPLPDPGALAAQGTQVVELCPAYPAPGHYLDLVQRRAVHREGALHPDSVTDLADRERL